MYLPEYIGSEENRTDELAGAEAGCDGSEGRESPDKEVLVFSTLTCHDNDHNLTIFPRFARMPGIAQLGEKLGLDVEEDVRILVLLWKLGSNEKPGEISKEEWIQGCSALNLDSWPKFKNFVPSLDLGFLENAEFKELYKFCFQFNRQGTHRTLDKDLVIVLLRLVLKERVSKERLDLFCQFLESSDSYSRITLDQWVSFLDFSLECEDLSNYDESTSAWPVMIDEFVEYMEKEQKMKC